MRIKLSIQRTGAREMPYDWVNRTQYRNIDRHLTAKPITDTKKNSLWTIKSHLNSVLYVTKWILQYIV